VRRRGEPNSIDGADVRWRIGDLDGRRVLVDEQKLQYYYCCSLPLY
jgi:hypothetical protein